MLTETDGNGDVRERQTDKQTGHDRGPGGVSHHLLFASDSARVGNVGGRNVVPGVPALCSALHCSTLLYSALSPRNSLQCIAPLFFCFAFLLVCSLCLALFCPYNVVFLTHSSLRFVLSRSSVPSHSLPVCPSLPLSAIWPFLSLVLPCRVLHLTSSDHSCPPRSCPALHCPDVLPGYTLPPLMCP